MNAGLAVARAWILLVLAAGCAKRQNPGSDRQQALPSRIVFSQLQRPNHSGSPVALEVNP
jgi:predicted outer membrane protein